MKDLQRTKVDKFSIQNAVLLEDLKESDLISAEKLCENYEILELNQRKMELFLNGVMLTVPVKEGIYRIYGKQDFIGLGIVKNELLKRDVVIKKEEPAKNVE